MVKTRVDLKLKIREFVMGKPVVKTIEVSEYSHEIAPNIRTSPNRIRNYMKQIEFLKYNKKKRVWENQLVIKTTPEKV